MPRSVICVSHATGAGGPDLGRTVAEKLDYRFIDEEVIARAAEQENVSVAELADVERRRSFLGRMVEGLAGGQFAVAAGYGYVAPPMDLAMHSPESLRGLIRQSLEELAGEGRAVIVSHAAAYALGPHRDVLRVLVTAPTEVRVRRFAEASELEPKAAAKSIAEHDTNRADYLKRFYRVGAELPTHYDLVLNTDTVPATAFADLVVAAASL